LALLVITTARDGGTEPFQSINLLFSNRRVKHLGACSVVFADRSSA